MALGDEDMRLGTLILGTQDARDDTRHAVLIFCFQQFALAYRREPVILCFTSVFPTLPIRSWSTPPLVFEAIRLRIKRALLNLHVLFKSAECAQNAVPVEGAERNGF